jgi:hypothetical protein
MTVHATDGGRLIALWDLMGNSEFSDNYLLEPTRRSQFKISGNEKIFWLGGKSIMRFIS